VVAVAVGFAGVGGSLATASASGWPYDIQQHTFVRYLFTSPTTGQIFIDQSCSFSGNPDSDHERFAAVGADGTHHWGLLDNVDPYLPDCPNSQFVDRNGRVFFGAYDAVTLADQQLVAFDQAGHRLWALPTPVSNSFACSRVLTSGADGLLYAVVPRLSHGLGSYEMHLLAIDPATGHVARDIKVYDGPACGAITGVHASQAGVLVPTPAGIVLVDYAGIANPPRPYPAAVSFAPSPSTSYDLGRLPDGAAIWARTTNLSSSSCSNSFDQATIKITIFKDNPIERLWSRESPSTVAQCEDLAFLHARGTADGGAVLSGDMTTGKTGRVLTGLAPNGTERWEQRLTSEDDPIALVGMVLDTGGTVVVALRDVASACDPAFFCSQIRVRFFNGQTGQPSAPDQLLSGGDPQRTISEYQSMAIGSGHLYVAHEVGPGTVSGSEHYVRVSRLGQPGLGHDLDLTAFPERAVPVPPPPGPLPPNPDQPVPPPPVGPPGTPTYVALGDSYSSGEGVDPFTPGTNYGNASAPSRPFNKCHRSALSYPYTVVRGRALALQHHACSGALVSDFVHKNYGRNAGEGPQLNHLGVHTKLVTVTVGGNDAGFDYVLHRCLTLSSDCSRDRVAQQFVDDGIRDLRNGRGQTCFNPPGAPGLACVPSAPSLGKLYRKIAGRAPTARIVVANYPTLFVRTPKHACLVAPTFGMEPDEMVWVNRQVRKVNEAIGDAVNAARRKGVNVRLADAYTAFADRGVCSGRAWIRSLKVARRWPIQGDQRSFHPTEQGQRAYARAFTAALRDR
jgi:outer membrane protein assembly factor BamB/lysophospholipase L1-like esterase